MDEVILRRGARLFHDTDNPAVFTRLRGELPQAPGTGLRCRLDRAIAGGAGETEA